MVRTYWEIFYLSLIGGILCLGFLVLGVVFIKKLFIGKRHGMLKFSVITVVLVFAVLVCGIKFLQCCKDYQYVVGGLFEEERAMVITCTYAKKDLDGNGQIINAKPKFLLVDRNETVVLYAQGVEIGKTYRIRYLPNTKICEVVRCLE